MSITSLVYRTATPADEAAVMAVWTRCLRAEPAWLRRDWEGVAGRFGRTFVAVDGGDVVSTVLLTPKTLRNARAEPERVGGIAAVATLPQARRRGHARRLLELAISAMRAEGCAWSLLFTGQPWIYTSLGYLPFPLRRRVGRPAGDFGDGPVRRLDPRDWNALAPLYEAFNAGRPLTAVRGELEWTHAVGQRLAETELLGFEDRGYAAVKAGPDGLDVRELAVTDAEAAGVLLAEVATRAFRERHATVTLRLPDDPLTEPAVRRCFTDLATASYEAMALPFLVDAPDLASLAAAPGGVFWYPDGF